MTKLFCQFSKKLPLKPVGTHATRIFALHAFRVRVCVAESCVVEKQEKARNPYGYEAVHVPEEMKPFIPDLPINLVEVAWLEDAVIDKFQSDFKVVAKFFKQLRLRGETCLDMNDPSLSQTITHFLDLMRLMSAYSHDPRFEAEALKLPTEKERNMLAVLTKLEDKGRKEGFSTLNRVYESLLKHGRQDDLIRAIQDPEYQKQIMAEFGLAEDGTQNS